MFELLGHETGAPSRATSCRRWWPRMAAVQVPWATAPMTITLPWRGREETNAHRRCTGRGQAAGMLQASCLASWRGAPRPSEAPHPHPLVRRGFGYAIQGAWLSVVSVVETTASDPWNGALLRGVAGGHALCARCQGWRGHNGGHSTRRPSQGGPLDATRA
jgi:hypothetical protein